LLHRLAAYEIAIAPLRHRRDDIAPLLLHFLRCDLEDAGGELRSDWLPAGLVSRLVRYDWPGNVRQLRNVARQLVIASRGEARARLTPSVERLLDASARPEDPPSRAVRRAPADLQTIGDDRLLEVLERTGWHFAAAARELGVSKTSMYQLVARSERIRKAKDLTRDEILDAERACAGDLAKMAARLMVSRRGLRLRMTKLGID
jgi:two-component system nitrogen regulation response regulator GlnG